jgi:CO/xanthine dehydrogenase Mo-binding subunit
MDRIAARLGLDPVKVREINALRPGDTTATGQRLGKDASALQVLRAAVKRTDFKRKWRALQRARPERARSSRSERASRRGIGLSLFFHGSGFTGGGEVKLASKATLALTDRGVRIFVGSTEIGQGTRTMHAQIVADTLGLPYDDVEVNAADTGEVPDSGPTVASRTCMVVGRILQRCAEEMRGRLGRLTPREYLRKHGPLVITKEYERPQGLSWDDTSYQGDAYGSYGWACDHADDTRHAGDGHRGPREPVPARSVRREGRRRDADRRSGAGGDQRVAPCRVRPASNSGDARKNHGGATSLTIYERAVVV